MFADFKLNLLFLFLLFIIYFFKLLLFKIIFKTFNSILVDLFFTNNQKPFLN